MRAQASGALAMAAAISVAAGAILRFVPSGSPLGPIARAMDSLSPWLLAGGALMAIVAAVLGLRLAAALICAAAIASGAQLYFGHQALSLPTVPQARADVRILFFNVYSDNGPYADRIVTAAEDMNPDIVVFAEGSGVYPALWRLKRDYAFVSPCRFEVCDLLIATRKAPLRFWQLSLKPFWGQRYAVAEIQTGDGKRFHLAISHLAKPWMSGIAEVEINRLASQYDWLAGPVVAMGDFNAAPWSQPMRQLLRRTGMRTLRAPVPTWPAQAGALGVPIDHVLVRGGVRVVRAVPFGDDLHSNHRGLLVDIAIP